MEFQAKPLVTQALENGNFDAIVDSRLKNDYKSMDMYRIVNIAAACVSRPLDQQIPKKSQVILPISNVEMIFIFF